MRGIIDVSSSYPPSSPSSSSSSTTSTSTSTIPPEEDRSIELGEMLYTMICASQHPMLAAKITGMLLLELDDDELMRLVGCERALDDMISEALGVLEAVAFGR